MFVFEKCSYEELQIIRERTIAFEWMDFNRKRIY